MTVRDLLEEADFEQLFKEFYNLCDTEYDRPDPTILRKVLQKFTGKLQKRSPVIDETKFLLAVYEHENNEVTVETYDLDYLRKNFAVDSVMEEALNKSEISDEEAEELISQKNFLNRYGIILAPWDEVLGYQVIRENVERFGGEVVLAKILREMTSCGFEESKMEEERKELKKRAEECDRICQLPKEEQNKYFVPAEEVFKKFGIVDERTEEEKKADLRNLTRKMALNLLEQYKTIQEFLEQRMN